MPTPINPYADIINFPPGTPPGIINQVLQIRALSDANQNKMANQPGPWETGLNNVIGGVTNHLLFPWLQNNFVNLPYQTDLTQMKTDEDIRQYLAQQSALTSEENQRGINKQNLLNDQAGLFGNAVGGFSDLQNQMTIPPGMDITGGTSNTSQIAGPGLAGSGGFDTVTPVDFSNQTEQSPGDITQIQGDLAPSGNAPIETATPGVSPSMSDVLRTYAGQDPMKAGLIAQALERNSNLANILDPLQLERRKAEIVNKQLQGQNIESQIGNREALLPGRVGMLDAQQQATLARAGLTYTQNDMAQIKLGVLQDIQAGVEPNQALLKALGLSKEGANPLASEFKARVWLETSDPNDPMRGPVEKALKNFQDAKVQTAGAMRLEGAPVQNLVSELPKVDTALTAIPKLRNVVEKDLAAVETLNKAGLLSQSADEVSKWLAWKDRQTGLRGAGKAVNDAYGIVDGLVSGTRVAFERDFGDQAARIKAAMGYLPEHATWLSYPELTSMLQLIKDASLRDEQDLISRRQTLIQQAYQGRPSPFGASPFGQQPPPPISTGIDSPPIPGAVRVK